MKRDTLGRGPGLMIMLLQSVAAFVGLFRKKIKCQ